MRVIMMKWYDVLSHFHKLISTSCILESRNQDCGQSNVLLLYSFQNVVIIAVYYQRGHRPIFLLQKYSAEVQNSDFLAAFQRIWKPGARMLPVYFHSCAKRNITGSGTTFPCKNEVQRIRVQHILIDFPFHFSIDLAFVNVQQLN